jgi:anti-sigma regulatory factor (Ser/Thr protein kinase)
MAKPEEVPDQLRITTAATDLARLYPWLEDAGARHDLAPKLLEAMHIALEEAVMNVAMHAILPEDAPEILVQLTIAPGLAELLIEDAGQAFDPVTAPEKPRPKSLAEAEPGGMGLKLLRRYCTNMHYERTTNRNRLTLSFALNNSKI